MTLPPGQPLSMDATLDDLAETFDLLGDWEERYRHVIDMGRALEPLSEDERNADTKVSGCASQVWLVSEREGEVMRFRGDSDAHIVRGLIAVLLTLYSGRAPREILDFDSGAAVARLGLGSALSSQRANGLAAMIARIREDAARAA